VSLSDHLPTDRAMFVLALDVDDPERRAALSHAEQCAQCRELLSEGGLLLGLLDDARPELAEELDPAFEERVHHVVFPKQKPTTYWAYLCLGSGALLSAALAWFAWRGPTAAPGVTRHLGASCFFYEQAFAASAFVLGALYARWYMDEKSTWRPVQSALLTMGGALVGQAILMVRCDAQGSALHLLVSHVFGVASATLLGALVGPRLGHSRRRSG